MSKCKGTLQRLPKIVGNDSLVRELVYTGRKFDHDEAKQMGLVRYLFDFIYSHMPINCLSSKFFYFLLFQSNICRSQFVSSSWFGIGQGYINQKSNCCTRQQNKFGLFEGSFSQWWSQVYCKSLLVGFHWCLVRMNIQVLSALKTMRALLLKLSMWSCNSWIDFLIDQNGLTTWPLY